MCMGERTDITRCSRSEYTVCAVDRWEIAWWGKAVQACVGGWVRGRMDVGLGVRVGDGARQGRAQGVP